MAEDNKKLPNAGQMAQNLDKDRRDQFMAAFKGKPSDEKVSSYEAMKRRLLK